MSKIKYICWAYIRVELEQDDKQKTPNNDLQQSIVQIK
jgi:hypothetical protein